MREKIEERKSERDKEKQRDYWIDILENLENYNGTPESQKEVRNINDRY